MIYPRSAEAFLPPAGSALLQMFRPCEVKIDIEPRGGVYAPGQKIPFKVTLTRLKGISAPIRGQLVLDSAIFDPDQSSLDPLEPAILVDEEGEPKVTFRSGSDLGVNQSATGTVYFQIRDESAFANDISLAVKGIATGLSSDGEPVPCRAINSNSFISIQKSKKYDLAVNLKSSLAEGQTVTIGQAVTLTAELTNVSTNVVLPEGTTVDLVFTYPTILDITGFSPSYCRYSPSISPPDSQTATCEGIPVGGLQGGQILGAKFLPTFKVKSYADFYPINACLDKTTDNEQPKENNCDQETLVGFPLELVKSWEDGSEAKRQRIKAGSTLNYKVTVKNIAGKTVDNIALGDRLMTSEDCNSVVKTGCPAWDQSVVWQNLDSSLVTEDPTTKELKWNQTFSLSAGQSRSYNLSAKVVEETALIQKLETAGYQARCNGFYGQVGATKSVDRLCWTYDAPAPDLSVSKFFALPDKTLVESRNIKQGELATYAIVVENKGQAVARQISFFDQQAERPNRARASHDHFIRWSKKRTDPALTIDDSLHQLNGWPYPDLAPGEKRTVTPVFGLVCDAYDRSGGGFIDNTAEVNTGGDQNTLDNLSRKIEARISDGHYKLGLFSTFDPPKIASQAEGNNTTRLTITLTNNDPNQAVDLLVPDVSVSFPLPDELEIVADPSNSPHILEAGKVIFTPTDVPINGSSQLFIKLKAKTGLSAKSVVLKVEAESVTASPDRSCGYTKQDARLELPAPEFALVKSVLSPSADKGIGKGELGRFQLKLSNISLYSIDHPMQVIDPLDINFSLVGTPTCESPDKSFNCATGVSKFEYDAANKRLVWTLAGLPAGANVNLGFDVKVDDQAVFSVCPEPLYNSPASPESLRSVLYDTRFEKVLGAFNPVSISVYSDQCLKGNLYARAGGVEDPGIKISSSKVVIDRNSILSARGTIACGDGADLNISCQRAPYKIGNYQTGDGFSSVGLRWESVVTRMYRNVTRLIGGAQTLDANRLAGTFDLYGGADGALQHPEGRVLKHQGNLTIDTNVTNFTGVGTIIVEGNLSIVGDGVLAPSAGGGSTKKGLGFIVLPGSSGFAGNVTIGPGVRQIIGVAIYAPGTSTGVASAAAAGSGIVTIQKGDTPLRPARGLFMARRFVIEDGKKAAFEYDPLLNSANGAPPGFSFTSSPDVIREGS